jgi:hypothetical protein
MKKAYIGDSYDIVKRFWACLLREWAPLYAKPEFIPQSLRREYTKLTGIPMLPSRRPARYSVFLDPDTGISLPCKRPRSSGHIPICTVVGELQSEGVVCVVTYDQSFQRGQREAGIRQKLNELARNKVCGFYYDSHAPFLFATTGRRQLKRLRQTLLRAGVPAERLVPRNQDC